MSVAKKTTFKPGQVIWAPNVADRNGVRKPQARPLLVIQPAPSTRQDHLCCLCISTDPQDDPDDPAILMPWSAEDGDTTGLYQWCRVVLLWFVQIDQSAVEEVSGFVTAAFLGNVIYQRNETLFWHQARRKKP
jgi:hypothetical protein